MSDGFLDRWWRALFGRKAESIAAAPRLRLGWFEAMLRETQLLTRYPEYAGVVARMDPVATNTVDSMAVGLRRWNDPRSRVQLLVNVAHFEQRPEQTLGVLLHEIQHVRLGHLTDAKFHVVAHPRLMELAMEVSANEPLAGVLGDHDALMRGLAPFGVAPGQSTMERYVLLRAAYDDGRLRMEDWWLAPMLDTHRPRQAGACSGPGLGDVLDARSDGASERNWGSERGGWMRGARTSPSDLERMQQAIAKHLRGERGGADDALRDGTQRRVAKELDRIVMEAARGLTLDWPRVLRAAFPRRRQVRPDYLRPNRRFPARIGEIPGRRRQPPKPTLLVGVDTSGSMSGETLDRVARELRALARHARLTIVECDAAVHRVYPMREQLGSFVGGGDTDFAPVFDEARGAHPFEGLVYFTDGKGSLPDAQSLPTLWAITHDEPFDAEWGSVVRLRS